MKHLTIILLVLVSCSFLKQEEKKEIFCSEIIKRNKLISHVINIPELQQYFAIQKIINQDTLVILKNEFVKNVGEIKKNGVPVNFHSREEIMSRNIKAFIRFEEIVIKEDKARVYFRYDIQGIGCRANFTFDNCEWKTDSLRLWEN